MRFTFTPEQEAFRAEVNAFLKETLPADWEGADNAIDDESYEFGREFLKKLAPKRWIAPAWPKEYGGLALSHWDQVIYNEAMGYARAPIVNTAAVGYLGPTIILYGSDEQKAQHLPGITSGDVVWCQGYSEPNSGSDLASLQTRAVHGRRRLRPQRAEDLDEPGALRRLDVRAGADGPGRAEAPGHQLLPDGHEDAGRDACGR